MRPQLHFTGQTGWINDPHGITWHNGAYHLFHQAIPDSLTHHPGCSWGHATSPDLLRFEHQPLALAPDQDEDGIWTGCLVNHEQQPRIFYTSVRQPEVGIGSIRVATPTDPDWTGWRKGDVVVTAPPALDLIALRDPFVLRDGDRWRMLLGASARDGRAMALAWESEDLDAWTYEGVALERSTHETEPVWMGKLWECPQFFEVSGAWAMISSIWDDDVLHHAGYAVGELADGRLRAHSWGQLTWGTYYAPSFFRDSTGRPCLMLWVRGVGDADEGWQSCLSIPHVVGRRGDRLILEPHPNLTAARRGQCDPTELTGPVDVEWRPEGEDATLSLDGSGQTTTLRVATGALTLTLGYDTLSIPWLAASPVEPIRVLVDGPVLEVWADGRAVALPIAPASRIRADGKLVVWSLAP